MRRRADGSSVSEVHDRTGIPTPGGATIQRRCGPGVQSPLRPLGRLLRVLGRPGRSGCLLGIRLVILVSGAAGLAPAEPFVECGYIVRHPGGGDCLLFCSDSQWWYEVENIGSFQHLDRVLVEGDLDVRCAPACAYAEGCVRDNLIAECPADSFGCGVLEGDYECEYFVSPDHGRLMLNLTFDFVQGDTVRVFGNLDESCLTFCAPDGCVLVAKIRACADTLVAALPATWGRIKAVFR